MITTYGGPAVADFLPAPGFPCLLGDFDLDLLLGDLDWDLCEELPLFGDDDFEEGMISEFYLTVTCAY